MTGNFVAGQRWISTTETELGLGIVEGGAGRHVVMIFPACGERRTYAAGNAPLSRVIFEIGDRIASTDGVTAVVDGRRSEAGRLVYLATADGGGEVEVDEIDLDGFVQFARPEDRLLAGRIDEPALFALRAEALEHRHRHHASPARGLLGPRVQLLPHQLFIAARIGSRAAPRALLADEVGLGKTIEAGLVLHQQIHDGRASRVLVLVPESLVYQWLVEMLRRFNLRFTIIDDEAFDAHAADGGANAFESAQLCLCPIPLVAERDDAARAALEAGWDVVVVDEVHRLTWSEGGASPAYRCVEALAARTPGLLLLTATPEQLGIEGHFARLRLIDPARYRDLATFVEEERGYRAAGELALALRTAGDDPDRVRGLLPALASAIGARAAARVERSLGDGDPEAAVGRAVRDLLDLRGAGRALFRNTRRAIGGFAGRRLHPHTIERPEGWDEIERDAPLLDALRPEVLLGEDWLDRDPRVAWLVEWLRAHRADKTLLLCARGETARALERLLRVRHGFRSCVFHEGMDLVARDRSAAYFAAPEDGAQVLLSSEIGSEGRNFQRARHLVLFDLPAEAELLEQRIGRLDRIGQTHTVEIHAPVYEGALQAALLRWYHEGLDAIERSFPAPGRIAKVLGSPPQICREAAARPGGVDALVERTRALAGEVLAELEAGRDRVLELSSFDEAPASQLVGAVRSAERGATLADFLERALDAVGVELERQHDARVIIRPTARAADAALPGLDEDGMTATCDRTHALAHEDHQFLTWEHPLVEGALDLVVDGGLGSAAVGTLQMDGLRAGTVLLEMLLAVHCPAPTRLHVARYLSSNVVRLVVDEAGRDYAAVLTAERMDRNISVLDADGIAVVVSHLRPTLKARVEAAERLAGPRLREIVTYARARVEAALGAEVERLEDLRASDPALAEEHADRAREDAVLVDTLLEDAQLRLDALRVVIAV